MINQARPSYPSLGLESQAVIHQAERQKYTSTRRGPGTILHRMIKERTGEDYTPNCGCNDMIRRMNAWGPTGCREHLDKIVTKMHTEAKKRPKWKLLASLPGVKLFMKRMVLSAIREAERSGT